jgi:hypothetical protein
MVTYAQGNAAYARHEALREDFAKHLRESKICVFDSSLERKLIRKYAQALLAGCVVVRNFPFSLLRELMCLQAGDIPTEQEDVLGRFMINLKPSWTIAQINEELSRHLQDEKALEAKALLGFAYARKHFTNTWVLPELLLLVADSAR